MSAVSWLFRPWRVTVASIGIFDPTDGSFVAGLSERRILMVSWGVGTRLLGMPEYKGATRKVESHQGFGTNTSPTCYERQLWEGQRGGIMDRKAFSMRCSA